MPSKLKLKKHKKPEHSKKKGRKNKRQVKHHSFRSRVDGNGVTTDKIVLLRRDGRQLMFKALKARACKRPPCPKRVSEAKKLSERLNKTLQHYQKNVSAIKKKTKNALSTVHRVDKHLDKKAAKRFKKSLHAIQDSMMRGVLQENRSDLAKIEQDVKKQLSAIKRFNSRR